MKLLCLNIWGGTIYRPLMDYLKELSAGTDIFCFQEVFSALPGAPEQSSNARMFLFSELKNLLAEFMCFFEPTSSGCNFDGVVNFSVNHGVAVFVRKNLSLLSYHSEILEQAENPENPLEGWPKAQVLTLKSGGKIFSIINFHGVAKPGDKQDTPQRLSHAKKLALVWDSLPGEAKILCGDFNMYPYIESIKILERNSKNLIKEFNIQNTRNELSWKKYPGDKQTFADYTFVSPSVKVSSFQVPYNEVSDHLPMILDFDL